MLGCDLYIFPESELTNKDYELILLLNTPILPRYSNPKIAKILKAVAEFMVAIGIDLYYATENGIKFKHKPGVWEKYKVDENNPASKGETCMFSVLDHDAILEWLCLNNIVVVD